MTIQDNPTLAQSWLGYKMDEMTGGLMVRICAHCTDKAIAEAEAKRLNCRVTHSICPKHFAEQMAKLTGEPAS